MKLDTETTIYLTGILEAQIEAAVIYKEAIDAVSEKFAIPKKPLRAYIKAVMDDKQDEVDLHASILQELIANKGPTQMPLQMPMPPKNIGITSITIASRDGSSTMTAH